MLHALNDRSYILLSGVVSLYPYHLDGRKRLRDFGGLYPSYRYLLTNRLWIQGGFGLATEAPVFFDLERKNAEETKYYGGIGLAGSVGYRLLQKKHFNLNLQARYNAAVVEHKLGQLGGQSAALLLGFNVH